MIRRPILRPPHSILFLAFVAMTLPTPVARAQDRAMQDRLDRLERDLSMLQRQVYRGAPSQVASAGPAGAVDAELRMDRLEAQMRELTGRVEDAVNGVEQLRRRLEQINGDIDLRFSQGQVQSQGPPRNSAPSAHASAGITDSTPAGQFAVRAPSPTASSARSRSAADPMPPGILVSPPPERMVGAGTLTPPGTPSGPPPAPTQPVPDTLNFETAANFRPPSTGGLPSASASEQYNVAFGLLKQADYPAAEEALKTFVAQHPKDALAGSAQYWLGETYYARGRYAEAASAFAEGYKNYPKGTKAADDLLKLGMSLARANQKQNACVAFVQLDHDFPNPGSSIKEHSVAEKKRLGC
ncbi:MAG: tol-pal system protein YbgF [Alphaproteobacteria bacterium]|nr:tol-pal system protein YbgF [Alphaproteobacteria bacterium]